MCPVPLSAEELREAEIWLIRREQAKYFWKEVESLKKAERYGVENLSKGNPIPKTSSLYSLTPFLDEDDLKRILKCCVLCRKLRRNPGVQIMADLPPSRVRAPNPPFTFTGVDFFDPMITKTAYRGSCRNKLYGALTCFQTRAVHLEVAQSLLTNDFLKAFSRFISRRSRPGIMFSDQGTNFVEAEREVRSLVKDLINDDRLKKLEEGFKWNFNPPALPHMGGAWESMVKLAKRAITATTNGYLLTDEELAAVFAECKAMLNNRSLTYVGCDPDNVDPLTPAYFLNTRHLTLLLPSEIPLENVSPKRRWLYLQSIISNVWKRWQNEYLPCIQ